MRRTGLAALTVAALLPLQIHAANEVEVRTTGDLLNICGVADDNSNVEGARGFCYGFLSGAANYHWSINAGKTAKALFCLPEGGVSRAEGARLFVAWGRANPQHLGEAPVDGLMRFAAATWPCKPAKR
jgi:hypothetical protein